MKPSLEERLVQGLENFADVLERGEDVTARYTCRKVALDLEPTTYGPDQVKETRALLGMSQALFAKFIGVSGALVRAWEQGTRQPAGSACRFMDEIRRDPGYWRRRFLEMAEEKTASC